MITLAEFAISAELLAAAVLTGRGVLILLRIYRRG